MQHNLSPAGHRLLFECFISRIGWDAFIIRPLRTELSRESEFLPPFLAHVTIPQRRAALKGDRWTSPQVSFSHW